MTRKSYRGFMTVDMSLQNGDDENGGEVNPLP